MYPIYTTVHAYFLSLYISIVIEYLRATRVGSLAGSKPAKPSSYLSSIATRSGFGGEGGTVAGDAGEGE